MYAYIQDRISELRKVVFPTREETIHTSFVVLVMIAIVGVLLTIIDTVFSKVLLSIIS